jgi:single-stranded-DNA-specific exonuclease
MPTLAGPRKRWIVADRKPEAEQAIRERLGTRPLLGAVLAARGFGADETTEAFLDPGLERLHEPRLLPDFEPAMREILGAKERGETIFVHGDYDVDGISSTALFSRFLTAIECKVITHVPHRTREGYGIHASAVDAAAASGAKLFLTCDCGVSAFEQVDRAKEAGMRVVVTDHHTIGATLPRAEAVVNPHRSDSDYPFQDLSGSGVVLKLCAGIAEALGLPLEKFYRAYLDLAVLGTVADVMPLLGENRVIAKHGLKSLGETKKEGLKALIAEAGLADRAGEGFRARDIGFGLGPRLNAAGRIDDARAAADAGERGGCPSGSGARGAQSKAARRARAASRNRHRTDSLRRHGPTQGDRRGWRRLASGRDRDRGGQGCRTLQPARLCGDR